MCRAHVESDLLGRIACRYDNSGVSAFNQEHGLRTVARKGFFSTRTIYKHHVQVSEMSAGAPPNLLLVGWEAGLTVRVVARVASVRGSI